MIALLVIAFAIPAWLQIPILVKKRWWPDLICFTVLWSLGLVLSIMISIGITLPPISTIITKTISGVFGV